eukprot:Polyplicarium_translucidae@DN2500_c0_g1_i1.p3
MRVEATRSAVRRRINAVPSRHCKRSTAASRQRATATVHLLLETFGQNCSIRRACREDRLRAERARVAQARGTLLSLPTATEAEDNRMECERTLREEQRVCAEAETAASVSAARASVVEAERESRSSRGNATQLPPPECLP